MPRFDPNILRDDESDAVWLSALNERRRLGAGGTIGSAVINASMLEMGSNPVIPRDSAVVRLVHPAAAAMHAVLNGPTARGNG